MPLPLVQLDDELPYTPFWMAAAISASRGSIYND